MTIDAGWVKLLKKGAPHAFTARRPFAPAAVFIDGQIKLMKSDAIRTWETFLKYQRERSSLLVHQTCVAPTIGTDRQ